MIDAMHAFGLEDLIPDAVTFTRTSSMEYRNVANGYHKTFKLTCFGCGQEFEASARQVTARRPWCPTCKSEGKPAAQRARDFRERHTGGE